MASKIAVSSSTRKLICITTGPANCFRSLQLREAIRTGGCVECDSMSLLGRGRGQQGIGCKEQHEQRSADP
ncbi:hypothetical protein UP10_14130 [Bradyrhizobium sp. LTSPM299]|nr:hypothetical protein UP10_14130 [Bradyrhizobium sp. LTSPM299]